MVHVDHRVAEALRIAGPVLEGPLVLPPKSAAKLVEAEAIGVGTVPGDELILIRLRCWRSRCRTSWCARLWSS